MIKQDKTEMILNGSIYRVLLTLSIPIMFLYFNINSIMNAQGNTVTPTILSGLSDV